MTRAEYKALGFALPDCGFSVCSAGPGAWNAYIVTGGGTERVRVAGNEMPEAADVLFRLLYVEAKHADMTLRDWVADWPDPTPGGRRNAILEWKRLRRQQRRLKALFPEVVI